MGTIYRTQEKAKIGVAIAENKWKELLSDPKIIAWIAGVVLLLKITPVWRVMSVLYAVLWRKWIVMLASSWVFLYFYKMLDSEIQEEIKSQKDSLFSMFGEYLSVEQLRDFKQEVSEIFDN